MNMRVNLDQNGAKHEAMSSYSRMPLFKIAEEMEEAKLPESFIEAAVRVGLDFEGVADLMILWRDEEDPEERSEIIADIQDMLDACLQKEKSEDFYVRFNDLDAIAKNIRCFKDSLLLIVNEKGGINRLADLTGIPQSSLSRFFKTNSMPHRSTLLKIAKALKLSAIKMETLQFQVQNH